MSIVLVLGIRDFRNDFTAQKNLPDNFFSVFFCFKFSPELTPVFFCYSY